MCMIAFNILNEKNTFYLHRYSGTVCVDQLRDFERFCLPEMIFFAKHSFLGF